MEAIPTTFMKDPVFQRLGQVAKYATLNEKEKKAYRESLKVYRDNYAIAETERTEGRAEGRAEGILEGEAIACRKVAKNMMKMGMDIETISNATGLSIQEIRNLN